MFCAKMPFWLLKEGSILQETNRVGLCTLGFFLSSWAFH